MKKLISLFVMLLALTTLSSFAAAPSEDVLAAIRRYRQALVKKDTAALENIWTNDYSFVNGHGLLLTKADRLADIKSGHSSIESIKHEDEPKVIMHGNTALVLSRVTIVGKYSGRNVSMEFRSLHVWLNENGHWRLTFNQLTPIEK
jgi:ketosteroid isomerase-like protein